MYCLMNKDTKLLEFSITSPNGLERCQIHKQYRPLPFWMDSSDKPLQTNVYQWLTERNAAKHRHHIQEILDRYQCNNTTGFIKLTHCLSLNDTLWVKSEQENLSWSQVSLYENPFDEILSRLAFDGTGLYGEQISTTFPESTTNGTFDKCWIRENGKIKLLKAGTSGASNAGLEPHSEVLASPIYEILCQGIPYTLRSVDKTPVSCCDLFTDENHGFKSAGTCRLAGTSAADLLDRFASYGCEDLFRGMIIADAVCINSDRHYGNFGFLINNQTFEVETVAPVFDYNLALFPYADWYEGFPDMETWMRRRGPVLGDTYVDTARALMTSHFRTELINLKDLALSIPTDHKFSKERLEIVNQFKNTQIDNLLGYQKKFDFQNIHRKYSR